MWSGSGRCDELSGGDLQTRGGESEGGSGEEGAAAVTVIKSH